MLVQGPGPQIVRLNIYQARRPRSADNAVIKGFAKIVGKDRNDIDAKHCH